MRIIYRSNRFKKTFWTARQLGVFLNYTEAKAEDIITRAILSPTHTHEITEGHSIRVAIEIEEITGVTVTPSGYRVYFERGELSHSWTLSADDDSLTRDIPNVTDLFEGMLGKLRIVAMHVVCDFEIEIYWDEDNEVYDITLLETIIPNSIMH